jgi:hypothetical protein
MYFDCFLAGSWMFTFGWFLVAIYMQHHYEKVESERRSEMRKQRAETETWRLPVVGSASPDAR